MDNDTSELAKLAERISKDPKSKLFVPLAEEYKKAGDVEMAISVLREGLKNNPGYLTARSSLGKLLLETGDLAGAQKEFEEVVKAMPDNIMAQRKLGDIYALQDRPSDALTHYKLMLSFNPRDQETALLVSDIETGHDIKARLARPKPVISEKVSKKQGTSEAGLASAMVKSQVSPPGSKPAAAQPPSPAVVEEAEEVLVVEPLEATSSGSLDDALSSKNLGLLSEPELAPVTPAPAEEDKALFDNRELFAVPQATGGDLGLEETEPWKLESETVSPEESDKKSDDFTTDTLAELYITQGFFEKAVEIYERLLADNPNSQGLKNKLAKVKAMAAESPSAAEPRAEDIPMADLDTGIVDGFLSPSSDRDIELSQPEDAWGASPVLSEHGEKDIPLGSAHELPAAFGGGFEPVEYVPPDAVPLQSVEETVSKTAVDGADGNISLSRNHSAAGRKETIERLENWLQKIMKEK